MKRSRLPMLLTFLIFLFLYIPIVIMVVNSFNESRFGGAWTGFSFKWYEKLFHESGMWRALRNTLLIGISATALSSFLGTTAALSLYRFKTKWQKTHYGLVYAPLVIPDILMGISLLLFFVAVRFQLSLFTVFIAHTTFCISYVTMVILSRLQNFDYSIIEAAQDLGASNSYIIKRIWIPLLYPGILAGALLAFTLSIDDFVITFFVAGQGATTLPIYVYSMIKFGSTPVINALSTLLLLVTFITVWLTQNFISEEMQK